jgi:RimJ/RimL family protein N-acetyltransferase
MLTHAFRHVEGVVFRVGPQNHRSQRALAKIGAVPADTRPDANGRECLLYALERGSLTRESPPRTG